MKSHSFDGVSFFSGLIITVIGLLFLVAGTPGDIWDVFGRLDNWFWPLLFLVVGVAVLVPALIPKKEREQIDSERR